MNGPKVIIALLLLLAVLFVVGIGLGVKNADQRPPGDTGAARQPQAPGWVQSLGTLLQPLRPKLKLDQKRWIINPAAQRHIEVPASKAKFRQAAFRLSSDSRLHITYQARDHLEGRALEEQTWPQEGDDPVRGSLVILPDGGMLTFTCSGRRACQVELE